MTKVFTLAHVPDGLEREWLQHLRDFDVAHPGCHFEVAVEAPSASLTEVIKMLQLEPGLTFTAIFRREGEKKGP